MGLVDKNIAVRAVVTSSKKKKRPDQLSSGYWIAKCHFIASIFLKVL